MQAVGAPAAAALQSTFRSKMKAWRIHGYSSADDLVFSHDVDVPAILKPNDCLVNVMAASGNPIDAAMIDGYGREYLNVLRQMASCNLRRSSEFPLTLGRDFSGVVASTGPSVHKFKPGDNVFGALSSSSQGSFAELALIDQQNLAFKPKSLSHREAASLPYVGCTAWSALCTVARLHHLNAGKSSILIHGGSGGVGSFAIQLMKAWRANVTTTCSSNAADLAKSLGADNVVDYASADAFQQLEQLSPYDVILDCAGSDLSKQSAALLGLWRGCVYVSLVSPVLSDGDKLGFPFGFAQSALTLFKDAFVALPRGGIHAWAFFCPNGRALAEIADLVDAGKIRPVIHRVLPFKDVPTAIQLVGLKHGRGKTVIDVAT